MPEVAHQAAVSILSAFHDAETSLLGRAAVRQNGEAGTIERVYLDEEHGLRFRFKGRDGKWPVSTLKMVAVK